METEGILFPGVMGIAEGVQQDQTHTIVILPYNHTTKRPNDSKIKREHQVAGMEAMELGLMIEAIMMLEEVDMEVV